MNVFLCSWRRWRVRLPPGSWSDHQKCPKHLWTPCQIHELGWQNLIQPLDKTGSALTTEAPQTLPLLTHLYPLQEELEEEEPEELGDRRARSKKEVDYTDSLTEKEWLRAIGVSSRGCTGWLGSPLPPVSLWHTNMLNSCLVYRSLDFSLSYLCFLICLPLAHIFHYVSGLVWFSLITPRIWASFSRISTTYFLT